MYVFFSDAFDLEYGVGILRLKEGLYCDGIEANEILPVNDSVHHKVDPDGKSQIESAYQECIQRHYLWSESQSIYGKLIHFSKILIIMTIYSPCNKSSV